MFGTFDSFTVTASTTQVSETDSEIAVTTFSAWEFVDPVLVLLWASHRGETV